MSLPRIRPHAALSRCLNQRIAIGSMRSPVHLAASRRYSQSQEPQFSYLLGASASGKRLKVKKQEHGQNTWTRQFAEHEPYLTSESKYSGEDAFFMSHIARSDRHVVFGLADGVGGWQDQGVDPAHFAHGLCRYMAEATYRPETEEDLRPKRVLQKGYDRVLADKSIVAGGSTAAVAAIDPHGAMEFANLGDSGFVILQPGKIAYNSVPQTHAFNTPYQLSKLTPRMHSQRAIFGGASHYSEQPEQADITTHTLRHGDLVVVATDGVWDNLSPMDVLATLSPIMQEAGHWTASKDKNKPQDQEHLVNAESLRALKKEPVSSDEDLLGRLAYAVMRDAKVASHNTRRNGPFAKEVHRNFPGESYSGGKVDDISVIVCLAVQDGEAPAKILAKL